MIVEQRVRRQKSSIHNGMPSEIDSDSVSDENDNDDHRVASGASDDEFLDCEPTPSMSLDATERSSSIASTRSVAVSVLCLNSPNILKPRSSVFQSRVRCREDSASLELS